MGLADIAVVPAPATDAELLFAKANGMTVGQYRQFLADQDDES